MKRFQHILSLLSLCVALTGFMPLGPKPDLNRWVIAENSTLRVNGKTNVNTFACEVLAYDQTDTLLVSKSKTVKEVRLAGCVNINIQSFDCHNIVMTHDLRKTLKVDKYPKMHIAFLTLSKFPELTPQADIVTGLVDIDLAGVRKRFDVNYRVYTDAENMIHLLGSRDVNFSDFNLIPPKKLGGIIHTDDKLSVDFHLKIKAIN